MPATLLFFLSGAAALLLQVLWTRMLGHVFGATTLAVSSVLTVFMAGLAVGSYWGGRRAARLKRPLLVFAALELAVGIYGLGVPTLLNEISGLERALMPQDVGFWGYTLARFGWVAAILIGPTAAMGATLPVLAEGIVQRNERMASEIGGLYAANTAGAVVGALAGGFYLIPAFGMSMSVQIAAGVDVLVALTVLVTLGARRGASHEGRPTKPRAGSKPVTTVAAPSVVMPSQAERRRALVVFALSGAAAMAFEVFWSRAVGVVIGASTYSFTLILTTFLLGLAIGAAVMSRQLYRLRDPVKALATAQIVVGVTAVVASMLVDRLPLLLLQVAHDGALTIEALFVAKLVIAGIVMMPSALALGTVMPLVIKILAPRGAARAGAVVGRAYAVNTMGAIAGSFLAGFVVVPAVGVERGVALAALLSVSLGVWLTLDRPKIRGRFAVVGTLAALMIVVAPRWDVRSWTSGLFRMYLARQVYADGWRPSGHVVYHRDGVASTVTVERQDDGVGVSLKVNGKVDASDIGDMPTQVLSGLLPILLHPAPQDVLVIGYGSGVTPGAVLQAPVRKLDVAEIESGVYEAANRHFAHVNHRPNEDPRATLLVDDGRNLLRRRPAEYDVIISEPSNPWMTGAASLFTCEFFDVARRRLRDDGIFLQWLQLYELSQDNVHTLMRTFRDAFAHVLVFTPDPTSNDMLMIGSARPLTVDKTSIRRKMALPGLRTELARAGFVSADDLLGLLLIDGRRLTSLVGPGPLNTDDNALIEFAAPKDLLVYSMDDPELPFVYALDGDRPSLLGTIFTGFGSPWLPLAERLLWTGRLDDLPLILARARDGNEAGVDRIERLMTYTSGQDDQPVLIANDATKSDRDYSHAAVAIVEQREEDAWAIVDGVDGFAERSPAHRFLYAFLTYRQEYYGHAQFQFEQLLADAAFVEKFPTTLYYAARAYMFEGEYRKGLALLYRFEAAVQGPNVNTM